MSTPTTQPNMGPSDWAALMALSVLWGGTFLFAALAVREIPPFTLVFGRVVIAAAALLIVLRAQGIAFPGEGPGWRAYFGMGLLNNAVPFSLIFLGQTQIAAGLASILNATTPLFTVLVLHFFGTERATALKIVGVVIGAAGVALLVGPDALDGIALNVVAQLAVLGAAISYAFALLWGRRFLLGVPPVKGAAGQLVASSVLMLPLALVVDRPWMLAPPSAVAIAALVAMALLSTALAYLLYFRLIIRAGGVNASLVTLLIPASAILLGALVLGERLDLLDAVGLALIVAALIVIDGRLVRRRIGRRH
jgi:drug/metabolite transporter (DMT)-like permease